MQSTKSHNQILNIHSAAVHIQHKISLNQHLAWFYLLYKAMPKLGQQNEFEVSLQELAENIGCQSTNKERIKADLRAMMTTLVEWNLFNKDDEQVWSASTLISDCEITFNSGLCRYSFSPRLQGLLSNPSMYAKLNLIVTKRFKSKYSLALYTFAMDYIYAERNWGIKNISLEQLRSYLSLDKNEYLNVGDVNRRIIQPAEKEINESSDMKIKISPIKTQRKITGYQFQMSIRPECLGAYKGGKFSTTHQNKPKSLSLKITNERLSHFLTELNVSLPVLYKEMNKIKETSELESIEQIESYLIFLMKKFKGNDNSKQLNPPGLFVKSFVREELYLQEFIEINNKNFEAHKQLVKKNEVEKEDALKSQFQREHRMALVKYLEDNFEENKGKIQSVYDSMKSSIQGMVSLSNSVLCKDWLNHPALRFELSQNAGMFNFEFPDFSTWKS